MTSLADQDVEQLGGPWSVLARQKKDHVRLDELLPRLQAAIDVKELRRLGIAGEAARRISPTRPHPVVSRRPPGNVLAALPLTAIDRTRDGVDRAARRLPAAAPVLTSASQALAPGAGFLLRRKALRRGEHRSTSKG